MRLCRAFPFSLLLYILMVEAYTSTLRRVLAGEFCSPHDTARPAAMGALREARTALLKQKRGAPAGGADGRTHAQGVSGLADG